MRNILKGLLLVCILILITSCKNTVEPNNAVDTETNNIVSENPYVTPAVSSEIFDDTQDGIVYENPQCGYQITFPSSWDGYYKIQTRGENNEITIVYFYGKSAVSKGFDENGLDMFVILPESMVDSDSFWDDLQLIGTVRDVKYFYATSTDSSIGVIYDAIYNPDLFGKVLEKTELELAIEDWEKAQEMKTDIEEVLNTFESTDL